MANSSPVLSMNTSRSRESFLADDSPSGCIIEPIQDAMLRQRFEIAISVIYCITSSLSIIGAGSIIVYSISKKVVRNPEVRPLFHLALADFSLALLWLIGVAMWYKLGNDKKACFYMDVIAEIFHLASFFLTVNYGVNVYIRLKERTFGIQDLHFTTVSTNLSYTWIFRILYVLCWLTPVLLMTPLIYQRVAESKDITSSCNRCLLLFDRPRVSKGRSSENVWVVYGSIMLASSLSLSIIALLVVYFMTDRLYRKTVLRSGILTDIQRTSIDEMRQRIFLYVIIFFVCWSPALVVASTDLDMDRRANSHLKLKIFFALFVAQGLTAPLQGFLNSIVYGWTRKSFRDATNQQQFLDSSSSFQGSYGSLGTL